MSIRTRKLRLQSYNPSIEGTGDELVYKLRGERKTKSGVIEIYELELVACRYSVRMLMEAFRNMQTRDLKRLEQEKARLVSETAPVQRT